MKFKMGGESLTNLNAFDKKSVFNPIANLQQTKNVFQGKGFNTDAVVKKKEQDQAASDAAALAAATPKASMGSGAQESLQAQMDIRRAALKNMGFLKTIYAGNTGGFNPTGAGSQLK